jgi:hypothetical protein
MLSPPISCGTTPVSDLYSRWILAEIQTFHAICTMRMMAVVCARRQQPRNLVAAGGRHAE